LLEQEASIFNLRNKLRRRRRLTQIVSVELPPIVRGMQHVAVIKAQSKYEAHRNLIHVT